MKNGKGSNKRKRRTTMRGEDITVCTIFIERESSSSIWKESGCSLTRVKLKTLL